MQFNEWLNEWLEVKIKPSTKTRTYEKYRSGVYKYISPALGDVSLEDLNAIRLQRFTLSLSEGGLAPSTVNCLVSILKNSLRTAVSYGITERQYSDSLVRRKGDIRSVACLNKEEQRILESYIINREKSSLYGILVSLYMGLRIGELLALTWADIDLEKRIMSVTKSCYDRWENGSYVKVVETPKTASSARLIPIPDTIFSLLSYMKRTSRTHYVVEGRGGYGAEVRSYQRSFQLVLKKLGLRQMGFHSLRHTFATRAIECGMDVKTLSELMGHKNPSITLTRYTHSLLEHKREMINKLCTQ